MRGYAADPVRGAGWFSDQPRAGNAGRLARLFDVAADDVLNLRNRLSLDAVFGEQVLSGCCTLAP